MGQYYYAVNVDKKEYLHPHVFGDGLKLMEFGLSSYGTTLALNLLLCDGNGAGGGDFFPANDAPVELKEKAEKLIGSWAGDRIVIAGDYADGNRFGFEKNLYSVCDESFTDISQDIFVVMTTNQHLVKELVERYLVDKGWSSVCAAVGEAARKANPMFDKLCKAMMEPLRAK